jgi:sensor histidine kinase YesM
MIKDVAAKLLIIPLLGILIPLLTGFTDYAHDTIIQTILIYILFTALTFLLWHGIVFFTSYIRSRNRSHKKTALKILLLIFCAAAFAFLGTSIFTFLWNKLFQTTIPGENTARYTFAYVAVAPLISMAYEILFMKKEQELDSKIVDQLDYERQHAELHNLKNELDPHFIFNSLNSLLPLIMTDSAKAQVFTTKLSQVYKYFLLNKDRELISLSEEMRFIEDYFFLLQIRHENRLRLHMEQNGLALNKLLILPFALQVLVENAIKHNHFSEQHPLIITISLDPNFVYVSNPVSNKEIDWDSTNIGLKNLSARYILVCHKDIVIKNADNTFSVSLPLIKTSV